jgi:hypothetical protein
MRSQKRQTDAHVWPRLNQQSRRIGTIRLISMTQIENLRYQGRHAVMDCDRLQRGINDRQNELHHAANILASSAQRQRRLSAIKKLSSYYLAPLRQQVARLRRSPVKIGSGYDILHSDWPADRGDWRN